MDNPSADRVRSLVGLALSRPVAARLDFLRRACGNDRQLFDAAAAALTAAAAGTTLGGESDAASLDADAGRASSEFRGTARFVLQRRIGAGSFGVVYEARDLAKNATVALKTLQNITPDSLYRFKREFRSLADVSHRNLVQLYELGAEAEHWFFTMELIRGRHFLDYARHSDHHIDEVPPGDGRVLDPSATGRILRALPQLVMGLDALHRTGHLHRDVKPANVLVAADERVVLLDFGLVVDVMGEHPHESLLIAGTPLYMSPEQAAGLPLTRASDYYSVGIMLYEAITGMLPFSGSYLDVLTAKQHAEPPSPGSLTADVPDVLDTLCANLLRRDPAQRPDAGRILETLHALASGETSRRVSPPPDVDRPQPFVGRRQQLSALHQALDGMLTGQTVVAAVSGPSGIGKSALLRAFLREIRAGRGDALILAGRCYERESVPYKALDSLVDALARHLKHLSPHELSALLPREIGSLAQLFPVLREFAQHGSARVADVRDAHELRRRAYGGLRELLGRIGDRSPLILFIDDLQWGDVDSATLLSEVLRPPDAPVCLLVAAYRDVEIDTSPFLRSFLTDQATAGVRFMPVRVDALDQDESQELAAALLRVDREMAGVIAAESGGSPFFIDELVRFVDAGADAPAETASPGQEADTDARETTLAHMLQIRLSRLPEPAQRILRAAAVNGRPLAQEILASAADVEISETTLSLLRAEHLLRARETGHGSELEPYHDRIREMVARSLTPSELREYHLRLAIALERHPFTDPELLAEHFSGAADDAKASHYTLAAARQAAGALAFDRAARLYRRALELLPHSSPERAACLVRLGEALTNAGRSAEAAAIFLTIPAATPAEALGYKQKAAQQLLFAGHIDEGLAVIREVLRAIGMRLPESRRATIAALLLERALVRLRRTRRARSRTDGSNPDQLMKVDACWSVAAGLAVVDTTRGAVFQSRHFRLALSAGEVTRIHRALCMEIMFVATAGPAADQRLAGLNAALRELSPRIDTPYARAMEQLAAGVSDYLAGRWGTAAGPVAEGERILRDQCTGVTWELDTARFFRWWSLYQLGELKTLIPEFPSLLNDAEQRGDLYASTTIGGLFAHVIHLAHGDPAMASRHTAEAIARWGEHGFNMPHLWEQWSTADIAIYQRSGAEAYHRLVALWPLLDRSLLLRVEFTRVSMLDLRARAALSGAVTAAGRQREAFCGEALRCAEELHRRRGDWPSALALLITAGVSALRGEVQVALDRFARAEQLFKAIGMQLHTMVAQRRRGELSGGSGGEADITAADRWMAEQGITDTVAFSGMLSPR